MPQKSRWARLSFGVRMATAALAAVALLSGTAGGVVALTSADPAQKTAAQQAAQHAAQETAARETAAREAAAQETAAQRAAQEATARAARALSGRAAGETGQPTPPATPVTTGPGPIGAAGTLAQQAGGTEGQAAGPEGQAAGAEGFARQAGGVEGSAQQGGGTGESAQQDVSVEVREQQGASVEGQQAQPAAGQRPAAATPEAVVRQVRVAQPIPFDTTTVGDPALPRGSKRVQAEGAPGERVLNYLVTLIGNRETSRRLVDSTVTLRPRHRVIAVGSRPVRPDAGQNNAARPDVGHKEDQNDHDVSRPDAGHNQADRNNADRNKDDRRRSDERRSAVCADTTKSQQERDLDLISDAGLDAKQLTARCDKP
ncbi:G5 domain-containing protein [Winogradskya consettensis]|nr:G5 domain-containing protein [Actinoplanes consettensis]